MSYGLLILCQLDSSLQPAHQLFILIKILIAVKKLESSYFVKIRPKKRISNHYK